jgi:hypothetical protein
MAYQLAVCGPTQCTHDKQRQAYRLGQLLAGTGKLVSLS